MRRAVRKLLLSPSTWLLTALVASLFVVVNGHLPQTPMALASASRDAADRYVQALQTGNVDTFLASLSPDARTQLGILGRFTGAPGAQAERRAAQVVLAQDHLDRYTRLGQHPTEDGSFVVYAVERDATDGTHTTPLVVWLDRNGQVARTTT
ncbi:MAG: hypothetical protein M3069_15120 [Chloroflexota bacterium]|nr:hypothetical protein [Chloroflexota bacterium]